MFTTSPIGPAEAIPEPVQVLALIEHLRLASDTPEREKLATLIAAARDYAERMIGRALRPMIVTTEWESLPTTGYRNERILPIAGGVKATVTTGYTVRWHAGRQLIRKTLSTASEDITYQTAVLDSPMLRHCLLMHAASLYRIRESTHEALTAAQKHSIDAMYHLVRQQLTVAL